MSNALVVGNRGQTLAPFGTSIYPSTRIRYVDKYIYIYIQYMICESLGVQHFFATSVLNMKFS